MRKYILLLIILVSPLYNYAQTNVRRESAFEFLPKGLNFLPLRAGIDEPRMGLLYYTKDSDMKVDIGNSIDVLGFNFPESGARLTIGADFMAYALVTSYLQYRLQIDAIDGFFGGNAVYSMPSGNGRNVIRFRYLHSSAHLVDGHWDTKNSQWINSITPTAYGNNYGELLFAREQLFKRNLLRAYAGFAMSTGKKTGDKQLAKYLYKAGMEYSLNNPFGRIFGKPESIIVAVNLDVRGIPEYVVNQNYIAGIKMGGIRGKGVVIYASYYNGGDVFNQYFNVRVRRFGLGFMFDFI